MNLSRRQFFAAAAAAVLGNHSAGTGKLHWSMWPHAVPAIYTFRSNAAPIGSAAGVRERAIRQMMLREIDDMTLTRKVTPDDFWLVYKAVSDEYDRRHGVIDF